MDVKVAQERERFRVKKHIIMLIEPDGSERRTLQKILESEGYPVIGVDSQNDAVDTFRLMPRDIGLVISRLDAGVRKGELAQSLRYLNPALKMVFAFTKKPEKTANQNVQNTVLTYYTPAPIDRGRLLEIVEEALA